jgi:hypothetical protein
MSVKVAVRVRPFNTREISQNSTSIIEMPGNNQTKIIDESGKEKTYTFDHSFWSHDGYKVLEDGYFEPEDEKYADQKYVFNAVGKEILDNAWQGYHCCLFAYGQTGSGKSYSMVGYGANKGIVPISCDEIFSRISQNNDNDKKYEVQVSMLEIYNEKVQDLLIDPNKRPPGGLKIRQSTVLGVYVEGLTKYPVTSYEEIDRKMEEGYRNRTIGATLMNATSSRAHTIVMIDFRQLTQVGKKTTTKISMINLVDLAGSERLGSTGASGDRLKEGCNINKSLLILGNVINCLADKAIGKAKNMLPPYRDSALTRILQNALGGNSKTVMICALSPASINYEETLSTLRYADRAKKIQNKAVINESEHDKMIRLLREENSGLKKMIEDLQNKLLDQGGVAGEDDKESFLELKDQYEANQQALADMQKTFQEKLEEAKKHEAEIIGKEIDLNEPHLVVLNEDPQLSHKLRYSLNNLPFYVGRKQGNPTPQIILSGIGIRQNHAIFNKRGDKIILKANDNGAKEYIFINGKKLENNDGEILNNKDRIIFGTNTILLFMEKSDGKDIYEIDWEMAQMEYQTEIEEFKKRQLEENEKKKEKEINLMKKGLEEEYTKKKNEMEEELKKKLEEYENNIKEMTHKSEIQKIEQERQNIEKALKEKIEQLELEKAKKKRELEIRERNELLKLNNKKKINEHIHSSEKFESTVYNLLKKISKMKIIINELKRKIELILIQPIDVIEKKEDNNLLIRVENYEEGTVYYWSTDTFHNRYDLMNELFNKYNDDEKFDIFSIKNTDDPLWDESKPSLLGYSFYKLEPVAYLMSNESTLSIISSDAKIMGQIVINIVPVDDNGNEFDEVPDDPLSDLIGQSLFYKVIIKSVQNLPSNFCKKIQIQYESLVDKFFTSTKFYNDGESRKSSFEINEVFEHHIDYLMKDDIEFLINGNLRFSIYAYEEVEKKGKTTKDDLLKHLIVEDEAKVGDENINMQSPEIIRENLEAIPMEGEQLKLDDKDKDCLIF